MSEIGEKAESRDGIVVVLIIRPRAIFVLRLLEPAEGAKDGAFRLLVAARLLEGVHAADGGTTFVQSGDFERRIIRLDVERVGEIHGFVIRV